MSSSSPLTHFMSLALNEARKGFGRTFPNPSVGCVVVFDGQVVGKGYHHRAGEPHAEVMALRSVPDDVDLAGCTLYVTLEPCCITGRTPACTSAIEAAGIMRVVIGAIDPDPRVHGKGVALLESRGVEVITGVMRQECEHLIRGFARRNMHGVPWVVAKWAMSLDGKIAARNGDSVWITKDAARHQGHVLRDQLDAVLVGKGTALADNPTLTCRIDGGRDPVRVLLDARCEVGLDTTLLDPTTTSARTLIVTSALADEADVSARRARGLDVLVVPHDEHGRLDMLEAMRALGSEGIGTVLVEGGGGVLGALRDARLIDEVHAFIAPRVIGGQQATSPVGSLGAAGMDEVFSLDRVEVSVLEGDDVYVRGIVPDESRRFITQW